MENYLFLQQYWWFIVSLLGAILVFLLFVQGGNSLLFQLSYCRPFRMNFSLNWGIYWERKRTRPS